MATPKKPARKKAAESVEIPPTLVLEPTGIYFPSDGDALTKREYTDTDTGERYLAATLVECLIGETKGLPDWAVAQPPDENGVRNFAAIPDSKKAGFVGVKFFPDGTGKYYLFLDIWNLMLRDLRYTSDPEFRAMTLLAIPRGGYGADLFDGIMAARQFIGKLYHEAIHDGRKFDTITKRLDRKRKVAVQIQTPGYSPDWKKYIIDERMHVALSITEFIEKNGRLPSRSQIVDGVNRIWSKKKRAGKFNGDNLTRKLKEMGLQWIR